MYHILIKAEISNEINSSAVSNEGILACHGYNFEDFPEVFDMYPFTDRASFLGSRIIFSLYGRLASTCLRVKKFITTKNQSSS